MNNRTLSYWGTLFLMLLAVPLLSACKQADQAVTKEPSPDSKQSSVLKSPSLQTRPTPDKNVGQDVKTAEGQITSKNDLKILHWNIESGGSYPVVIAGQLEKFAKSGYQILALSEVNDYKLYQARFDSLENDGRWQSILGASGIIPDREDDRLMIFFDSSRLKLISSQELNRYGDFRLNNGRHRSPLVAHFRDRISGEEFLLLQNHLARGDAKFRAEQAAGLREFARNSSMPLVAVGDFNLDFVFETRQGNEGFTQMMKDGIWSWVEPEELIDTNWFDPEPDGIDNYPGSLLDFSFVAGPAKSWNVSSRVIVRDGDFPDDEKTSDHRPVEVVIRF